MDEAGTPDIFVSKSRNNEGQGGCSRFFMPGMLEVNDPDHLAEKLKALREGLIADLYFYSAESFKRVPYEVSGESEAMSPEDFMLLCGLANRAKSWSCEHCENWKSLKKQSRRCGGWDGDPRF